MLCSYCLYFIFDICAKHSSYHNFVHPTASSVANQDVRVFLRTFVSAAVFEVASSTVTIQSNLLLVQDEILKHSHRTVSLDQAEKVKTVGIFVNSLLHQSVKFAPFTGFAR